MSIKQYDIIVIGAGSGGLTAAVGFAKAGKTVLLVEKANLGGECTNTGCVPSKALLHYAKNYAVQHTYITNETTHEVFRNHALPYVQEKIATFGAKETPEHFTKLGITVVQGEAHFHTPTSIKINEDVYTYARAIIATGSSPRTIVIPGVEAKDTVTNQTIFDIKDIPEKLLILGGGPIGLELGQAFALLGSKVTIATIDTVSAAHEDSAISHVLIQHFTKLGIRIIPRAHITHVENRLAYFDIKHEGVTIDTANAHYSKLLIAIGRVPNLPHGLKQAEIAFDTRSILVDAQHRTSNSNVYAIGDVAGPVQFTHTADNAARDVVKHVVSRGLLRSKKHVVPKVTYTEPEIAQVGLSWEAAKTKYVEPQLMRIEVPFTANDRAYIDDVTDGVLVIIARRLNGAILGAHCIGPRAGELIALLTVAIDQKISLWKLQNTIFAYPTYSLIIKKAADQFVARQLIELKHDIWHRLKRHATKIIAAFFWIALIYQFQAYRITHQLSYQAVLMQLYNFFTMSMYGPLIYIVLYAIRPLIFFPATLFTALSGALFGFWWGVIYTIFGENASANMAYWIGRFFGRDLMLEDTTIGNWVEKLRDNSFAAVLLMRLFYFPFDLTNYGAGIVRANWREYALATLIGIMPGLTTFVALGAAINIKTFEMDGLTFHVFEPKFLLLSVTIFVISLVLSQMIKKWHAAQ